MADTLSIKQDDGATDVENLTQDEQESLQVGEKMAQEQGELLAGKYKNAEDLEKAYVELQKKLGDNEDKTEEPEAVDNKEEVKDDDKPEKSEAYSLIETASDEYYANNESLSADTLEKFKSMSSQDLVNAYIQMSKDNPNMNNNTEADVTTSEINKIQNSVGGETQYNNLVTWAGDNLPEQEIKAFDDLVGTGNSAAIQLGVDALKSKYEAANGYEGRRLTGKAADTSGDVFKSQAQLVEAMSDPRYDRDPAYRQDVVAKLERSDIDF